MLHYTINAVGMLFLGFTIAPTYDLPTFKPNKAKLDLLETELGYTNKDPMDLALYDEHGYYEPKLPLSGDPLFRPVREGYSRPQGMPTTSGVHIEVNAEYGKQITQKALAHQVDDALRQYGPVAENPHIYYMGGPPLQADIERDIVKMQVDAHKRHRQKLIELRSFEEKKLKYKTRLRERSGYNATTD